MKNWLLGAIAAALLSCVPLAVQAQQVPPPSFGTLNASAATGACTTQACVTLSNVPTTAGSSCWVEVGGTFVATMVVEGSLAGTAWVGANITAYGGTASATSITAVGLYQAPCGPNTRVRMSAYTSGSATVQLYPSTVIPSGVTQVSAPAGTTTITNPLGNQTAVASVAVTLQGFAGNNTLIGGLPVVPSAVTGHALTRSAAASVTAGTAGTICSGACSLMSVSVAWGVTSTAGVCWLTLYNATAPTVGTAFVEAYAFSTAAPGSFAAPIPSVLGETYATAVTFAVTTTPNGSTACNTTANSLFVQGAFI